MMENKVIIYTANDGKTKIDVKLEEETLWLTQAQMCELYQSSKSNISEHIKHIFEEGELNEESVVRKFRTTAADGTEYLVSHEEAMEHATTEYRKYKQRTISDVERDYLFSIKSIEDSVKKND